MAFIPRIITKLLDIANLQRHNDNYSDIKTELDKIPTIQTDVDNLEQANVIQDQRIDNIVASGGESNIEIVDARLPEEGVAYPTLKDRLDTEYTELDGKIETYQASNAAQLADIATNIETQSDLESLLSTSVYVTCNIGGVVNITSNITLPEKLILKFNNGGKLRIASGVTLTVNSHIEAGYYQIFEFVDATSQVATKNIGVWNDVADSTIVHYNVKVDWFGAKPDAAPPVNHTGPQLPTGTDSSDGFRRAFKYALQASVKTSSTFLKRPKVTVEAAPNGCYYVKGNNLMGCQDTSVVGMLVDFEGNSCQILHEVLVSSDTLIDNAYKMYSPKFRNFDVDIYTQLGSTRVGKFLDLKGGANAIEFVTPTFSNIRVGTGYEYKGYDIVFNIDGTTMADNGHVVDCVFGAFNILFNCVNGEAVNWKFEKNYIQGTTINSTMFKFYSNFSGSFTAESNEMLIAFNGERILKTVGAIGDPGGLFKFSGRLETRIIVDTTFFDLDYGTVEVEGFNFFAGSGAGSVPDTTRIARIGNGAFLSLKNSNLTTKDFDVGPLDQAITGSPPANLLHVENTALSGAGHDGYPLMHFKLLSGSEISMKTALESGYKIRKIIIDNPNGSSGMLLPLEIKSEYGYLQKASYARNYNNTVIAQGVNARVPYFCVIKSIKLYCAAVSTSVVNQIAVNFKFIDGFVTPASFVYALDGAVKYGVELLNNEQVVINTGVVNLNFQFQLTGAAVTDANAPKSYIEIEYRGISSLADFNADTSGVVRMSIV